MQTPETLANPWQLREILILIGLIVMPIGYLLKKHLDDKRERFKNARVLTKEQFDAGLDESEQNADVYQQALLDRGFYLDIEQIKAKDWSTRYRASLDKLQSMLAKWFGEKLHYSSGTPQNIRQQLFGCDSFTSKSYEFCLKLALIYPLLFAVVNFVFSGKLQMANLTLLSVDVVLLRILMIVSLILAFLSGKKISEIDKSKALMQKLKHYILLILFLIILTILLYVVIFGSNSNSSSSIPALASAISLILLFSLIPTASLISSFAFTFSFITGGALIAAKTMSITYIGLISVMIIVSSVIQCYEQITSNKKVKFWLIINGYMIFSICASVLIIMSLYDILIKKKVNTEFVLIPIFSALLPLLNAAIDWCSLNITRGLLAKIRQTHHHPGAVAGFVILDILLAIGFILLVTTVLVSTLAGINSLGYYFAGALMLDFNQLMTDIIDPATRASYYWVHAMVLSTLIPTLFHFAFALYALVLTPAKKWAEAGLNKIKTPQGRTQLFYCSTFSGLLSLILTITVLALLMYGLWSNISNLAMALWHWADMLLMWFDAGYRV